MKMTLANLCVCLKSMNITLLLCVAISYTKPIYSTSLSQLNSNCNERWVKPAIRIEAQHTHQIIGNYVLAAHIINILVIVGWSKRKREGKRMKECKCKNEKEKEKDPDRGSLNSPFRCMFDLEWMKRCMKHIYEAKIVWWHFEYQIVNRFQPTFISIDYQFREFHGNFN